MTAVDTRAARAAFLLKRRARRLAFAAVLLPLVFDAPSAHADAPPDESTSPTFGLSFAIARENGERIVDDAWIHAQIEDANHFFAPLGTKVRWLLEKELAAPHGEMHSRADRHALTPLMERGVIDVFVVRELEDVDEPGRRRMGVCWTGKWGGLQGQRFIILSRTARRGVLAHELGHFFGNHQHSTVVNNLMSYSRDGGTVFLDDRQIATIRSLSSTFLSTKRLIDVGPPLRLL